MIFGGLRFADPPYRDRLLRWLLWCVVRGLDAPYLDRIDSPIRGGPTHDSSGTHFQVTTLQVTAIEVSVVDTIEEHDHDEIARARIAASILIDHKRAELAT